MTRISDDELEDGSQKLDYLASFRLLLRYAGGARKTFIGAILLATFAITAELVPVWSVYQIVTAAFTGALSWSFVLLHTALAVGAILIGFAAMGLALGLSHIAAFDVIYRLRLGIARHMARLPLGYFADLPSGDAKKMVIDEPEKMELIFAHGLPESISALATWLAVSVWLFVVDWRMAIAAILTTPISFVLLSIAVGGASKRAAAFQSAGARMNASVVEYLAGMPVVKIFNRTGDSFAETSAAVRAYVDVVTAWAREYLPLGGAFYTLVLANIVIILPVGLVLLHLGEIDLPTLLLFVILGANYSQPLIKLFNQYHTIAHISMGSTLVGRLLDEAPQADTARQLTLPDHDVTFDAVSFGYGERDVLRDVSFTAKAGEVTALVGPSGSGKTTIASLIPRFWDVRTGRVTIGGIDVRDISLDQLMDTVAFVFQDTFLFSDTIAANIRFGNPGATDEEVEAAAKAARAHDFIMALPQGYDTPLGERGGSLSGGERQRIAIARTILKNAPVIVLDEATAFADPDNEAAIQEAIGALTAGRTLIVVAHRLHTIADADSILVIDGGRISESGRHEALTARGGLYAWLWEDYVNAQAIALRPSHPGGSKGAEQ
ncbi:ABC transporter-related [Glycocaulis alkaliphilus]|uniref:ABC transporter-related n=1 Tax=Glycocaulis alkaliphilus TaxID=1434191 RepID=A0A3T0E864_9PROT|nr:ABC transporter ATP-binding protein [Glycocaulis alkaliphilus]AZU03591.1 ABC transporter-related [Glycocaulis alkaliphilus]GGB82387.1 HlyB/MsbA family ABC transporter [Glycocaulis alkaliphilus]